MQKFEELESYMAWFSLRMTDLQKILGRVLLMTPDISTKF